MVEHFFKVSIDNIRWDNNVGITEEEKAVNEVYGSGAVLLYRFLYSKVVRKGWCDSKGYPIVKNYYSNGTLACSFSIPHLMEVLGYGERKIKGWINILVKAKWILLENKTVQHQNIFIVGRFIGKDKDYKETLLKDIHITEANKDNEEDKITEYYRSGAWLMEG